MRDVWFKLNYLMLAKSLACFLATSFLICYIFRYGFTIREHHKSEEAIAAARKGSVAIGADMEKTVEDEDVFGDKQTDSHDTITVSLNQLMKSPFTIQQDNLWLLKKIKSEFLYPPSDQPYNLSGNKEDPSMGQTTYIRKIFKDRRRGFFVECGGLDGETRSNTLFLEKTLGWEGLLVEADPKNFDMLRKKNRKSWALKGCLSVHPYPNSVIFKQNFNVGRISAETDIHKPGFAEVQCFPLYSVLLALNTTVVDFLSLDVEGDELKVLKTIPWGSVDIKTISVEFIHTDEGKSALRRYIMKQGYDFYRQENNDLMFTKLGLKP